MAELGSFSFLPWLRRGMACRIGRVDGSPPPTGDDAAHVRVTASVTLNGDPNLVAAAPLTLFGPGEVTGVDRDAIIRVAPTPDTFDVEPNYLPLLELDQADLPWRYTPARNDANDRLTPWLCLVVLRDDEVQELREPADTGELPVLTVPDAGLLPRWSQLWAWAHVQISGAKNLSPADLRAVVESEPERAISRLLCPRRLEPFTAYTAFLVPTFERGRRAGAGEPVPPELDALAPAWGDGGAVRLPVYFRWRFGTSAAGDFEFLVRQLEARVLPPTVGRRDLDVSAPGDGLPAAFDRPLGLEGALSAIDMERTDWAGPVQATFVGALSALVNLPADRLQQPGADRAIVPPLYGRWHAQAERETPGAPPIWFNELNRDPRERSAAASGTRVIQQQQRQLMASAWQQVQGIREANDRLRLTQLARELGRRLHRRHLPTSDADQLLQVGAPVLSRILASPTTIRARLQASPVLPGTLDGQFRRISRPRGPMGRRQGRSLAPEPTKLYSRLNSGQLRGAPPPATSPELVTPAAAPPRQASAAEVAAWRARARRLPLLAVGLLFVALVLIFSVGLLVGALAAAGGAAAAIAAKRAREQLAAAGRSASLARGTLTAAQLEQAPPRPDFQPTEAAPGALSAPPAVLARNGAGDTPSAAAFRTAAARLMTGLGDPVATPPALEAVPLAELRVKVTAALDPRTTVVAGLPDRLRLPGNVRQPTADPAEPVMAAPHFPQPMYAPLAAVSQDWLLPGLAEVPPNTVTTALTNQRFIEAYMVGLNHEMARELQWNEYPTDMRGTYFQQFWDPAGSDGAPASLLDITPLASWDPASALGAHPARTPPPGGQHLVLLIRGEVFRRYPNTQVYAVKAKSAPGGVHALGDEERLPIFSGRLQPDVAFFGFALTATEARGDESATSANQGWFFVLQEHPSEPRFGLDVPDASFGGQPATWSDLSWGNLATDAAGLGALRYIDLAARLPDTSLVSPTGGARWHVAEGARASDLAFILLQQPMRVAVHGSDMIPPPAEDHA
jgi:hypothetical protein